MPRYKLETKIRALDQLDVTNCDYAQVSAAEAVPVGTLRKWHRQRESLRREYHAQLREMAARRMAEVQHEMARKAAELVAAMDKERITKAPLNQLSSALGVLVDRYLKLEEASNARHAESGEQVIRYEYKYPDGSIHDAPPWANDDSEAGDSLQSGGVRQTLRQDGTGKTYPNGPGREARAADVVAGADLPDGESGLAGSQDYDDEHNWYHD